MVNEISFADSSSPVGTAESHGLQTVAHQESNVILNGNEMRS